jgi:hypothetical protein
VKAHARYNVYLLPAAFSWMTGIHFIDKSVNIMEVMSWCEKQSDTIQGPYCTQLAVNKSGRIVIFLLKKNSSCSCLQNTLPIYYFICMLTAICWICWSQSTYLLPELTSRFKVLSVCVKPFHTNIFKFKLKSSWKDYILDPVCACSSALHRARLWKMEPVPAHWGFTESPSMMVGKY